MVNTSGAYIKRTQREIANTLLLNPRPQALNPASKLTQREIADT